MKNKLLLIAASALLLTPTIASANDHIASDKRSWHHEKAMEKADLNGDGYITKAEMVQAHNKRIDKMFERFDTDKDGRLSKEELAKGREGMRKNMHEKMRKMERNNSTE